MAESPYAVNVQPFYAPITNVLCNEPPYGMVTAINMNTKKVIWQKPLGTAEHNGPFGLPTYLPINIGTPNNGGPIITDGGVVFVAAATDNRCMPLIVKLVSRSGVPNCLRVDKQHL